MKPLDGGTLAVAALIAVEGVRAVNDLMPSLTDVRRSLVATGDDLTIREDVRAAELTAAVTIGVVGAGVSVFAGTPVPLALAVAGVGALVILYEWQLRRIPAELAVAGPYNPPGGLEAEIVREDGPEPVHGAE